MRERVTASRVNKLEELWKTNPEARVADVAADADAADDAPRPVASRVAGAPLAPLAGLCRLAGVMDSNLEMA